MSKIGFHLENLAAIEIHICINMQDNGITFVLPLKVDIKLIVCRKFVKL